jgi:hypothetical protein
MARGLSVGRTRPFLLLLLGIVLVLSGVLLSSLQGWNFLARLLWLGGAVAGLLFLIRTSGEMRFLLLHLRSFSEPGLTVTLLLAGILLLAGSLAFRTSTIRWDLTRQKAYSLSPVTREVVRSLDRDVEIIAFVPEGSSEWKESWELLRIFAAGSRRLSTRRIDPESQPSLARRYEVEQTGLFLLLSGDRQERVTDLSERALTAGLIRLATGKGRQILFSRGHGEAPLRDGRPSGLSKLRRFLGEDGYYVGNLHLAMADSFPEPPGTVVLAGPASPLLPGEIRNLFDYLDRGGRVALFAEPGVTTGLEQGLLMRGVRILDDSLGTDADWTRDLGLESGQVLVEPTRDHPSVSHLGFRGLLDGARGVEPGFGGGTLAESAPLLEVSGSRGDSRACAAVAAAWQIPVDTLSLADLKERPWARVVVAGDADVLTNRLLEQEGNRPIVLSLLHWLAQEDLLLRTEGARTPELLIMSVSTIRLFWVLMLLVLPLAVLVVGVSLWLHRRGTES